MNFKQLWRLICTWYCDGTLYCTS